MSIRSIDTILESKIAEIQSRLPAQAGSVFSDIFASCLETAGAGEGQDAVRFAMQYIGTPYAFGGTDLTSGIDCSAFVRAAYDSVGIELPRTAYEQSQVGRTVSLQNLMPGDLLFFKTSDRAPITHVGMYIGNNRFIHSSVSGNGVGISDLNDKWRAVLKDARRVTA
jgi:cell wall-associated NlpC family hydrolase